MKTLVEKAKNGDKKDLFRRFCDQLIILSVRMVTVSPPMILHKPDLFDKQAIHPLVSRNPESPLHWLQPVVLRNLYGHVCVKGRADNKEKLRDENATV